jgi:Asp-tRNA(Asn)/Glu-tRNA(Gln) amidotransferase A subunit family amidase
MCFLPPAARTHASSSKLKVGYYVDDGFIESSPACGRAVLEAVAALRQDGHSVVEFKPPR